MKAGAQPHEKNGVVLTPAPLEAAPVASLAGAAKINDASAAKPSPRKTAPEGLGSDGNGGLTKSNNNDLPATIGADEGDVKRRKTLQQESALPESLIRLASGTGAADGTGCSEVDLSTPAVETDTEYPTEGDLTVFPPKLIVRESGSHKIDGLYSRLLQASRGRPAYIKWVADKKPMYLFWNRRWVINTEFGSTARAYAYVEDATVRDQQQQQQQNSKFNLQPPCEPYPNVWRVREKKDKTGEADVDGEVKHKIFLPMRVLNIDLVEPAAPELLPVAPLGASVRGSGSSKKKKTETPLQKSTRPKEEKEKLAKAKKDLAGQSNGHLADADNHALSVLLPGSTAAKKDEAPGPASSSEEEEESDDDTSSTSSSSSLPAVQVRPKPPAPRPDAPMAASPQQKQLSALKMKEDIKKKVREELTKDSSRFWRLRALMIQKVSAVEHLNSLTAEDVGKILDEIGQEFNVGVRAPVAEQKIPTGAPPDNLPQQDKHALGFSGQPETEAEKGYPCQGMQPKKSALRKSGMPRQRMRNIRYIDTIKQDGVLIREINIASFRFYDNLWYKQPGALVECDSCNAEVPQMMGSLQGAPYQSQFAQDRFVCAGCMGGMGGM